MLLEEVLVSDDEKIDYLMTAGFGAATFFSLIGTALMIYKAQPILQGFWAWVKTPWGFDVDGSKMAAYNAKLQQEAAMASTDKGKTGATAAPGSAVIGAPTPTPDPVTNPLTGAAPSM
jgi:hypothetical protein